MEKLCRRAVKAGKEVLVIEPTRRGAKATRGNFNLLSAGAKPLRLQITAPRRKAQLKLPLAQKSRIDTAGLDNYLWHFTRECAGPWPGQTWDEYFADLAAGKPEAAHEAIDSLDHILREGVILARGGMVRGGYEVVCWSARSPVDIAAKPVYRSALGRWNFKPYAIGIRRNLAQRLGAKPVIYGSEENYRNMPEEEKHLFQLASTKTADWRREEEWRTTADFHLDEIKPSDGLVLVHNLTDRSRIEQASRFAVVSMDCVT